MTQVSGFGGWKKVFGVALFFPKSGPPDMVVVTPGDLERDNFGPKPSPKLVLAPFFGK
jgi:hypothetical protein